MREGQAADDPRDPADETPAAGGRKKSWRQLMVIVVAAIVLMLFIKAFVVQVYRIHGRAGSRPSRQPAAAGGG